MRGEDGWMSAADIVRETKGKREMTLQTRRGRGRERGREGGRMIQGRGGNKSDENMFVQ